MRRLAGFVALTLSISNGALAQGPFVLHDSTPLRMRIGRTLSWKTPRLATLSISKCWTT